MLIQTVYDRERERIKEKVRVRQGEREKIKEKVTIVDIGSEKCTKN